jgi:hypothetical protein
MYQEYARAVKAGLNYDWRNRTNREGNGSPRGSGEDPSLVDFKITELGKSAKMAVADRSNIRRWKKLGARKPIRESGLTQKPV